MGIKNKIKDKVLDVIERMYPNNLEINDNIEPKPERDRYGLTKEDWIGREDDESFSEMLRETYDPDYDYELEEYIKNYKALNDVRDDNKLEILTFIRDLEKFKVEMLDDLLDNKLQEKVKTGLIFSSGYVFKDFDFKTDDFKTNITDEQFKKYMKRKLNIKIISSILKPIIKMEMKFSIEILLKILVNMKNHQILKRHLIYFINMEKMTH